MADDISTVRGHLQEAMLHIKQAIDASVKIKLENSGEWKNVTDIWEEFMGNSGIT